MRFGGHETFTVREGWLTKGLRVLLDDPQKLVDEFAEDHLGVGRNMAKAIRHWLIATGLAEFQGTGHGKVKSFSPSELGEKIFENDPYMMDLGTWWILHLNLINNNAYAPAWSWFFNVFSRTRFERSATVEALSRHMRMCQKRVLSPRTIDREIACILNTYAVTIPRVRNDPEDATDCPFSELGLLQHFKSSGYYQFKQGRKWIAPPVIGLALSFGNPDSNNIQGFYEVPLTRAAHQRSGPGHSFQLTTEELFELFMQYENQMPSRNLSVIGLAGERVIRFRGWSQIDWVNEYYNNGYKKKKIA